MPKRNVFLEDCTELHARIYAVLLGPVPDGIVIDADGHPSRDQVPGSAEYRNRAADICRTLHGQELD